jgi:hypothetical protein
MSIKILIVCDFFEGHGRDLKDKQKHAIPRDGVLLDA